MILNQSLRKISLGPLSISDLPCASDTSKAVVSLMCVELKNKRYEGNVPRTSISSFAWCCVRKEKRVVYVRKAMDGQRNLRAKKSDYRPIE